MLQRRSKSRFTQLFFLFLQSCVREVWRTRLRRECMYIPLRLLQFCQAFTSVFACVALLVVFLLPSVHNCFHQFECAGPRALRGRKNHLFRRTNNVTTGVTQNQICKIELLKSQVPLGFEIQKQQLWQYRPFKSSKIFFHFAKLNLKQTSKSRENPFFGVACFIGVSKVRKKSFWVPTFLCTPLFKTRGNLRGLSMV